MTLVFTENSAIQLLSKKDVGTGIPRPILTIVCNIQLFADKTVNKLQESKNM